MKLAELRSNLVSDVSVFDGETFVQHAHMMKSIPFVSDKHIVNYVVFVCFVIFMFEILGGVSAAIFSTLCTQLYRCLMLNYV